MKKLRYVAGALAAVYAWQGGLAWTASKPDGSIVRASAWTNGNG